MDNIEKVNSYQRLKIILSEGEESLTEKASKNIDEILGIDTKKSFIDKLKDIFNKIDSMIFKKPNKITNRYQKRK